MHLSVLGRDVCSHDHDQEEYLPDFTATSLPAVGMSLLTQPLSGMPLAIVLRTGSLVLSYQVSHDIDLHLTYDS